MNIKKILVGGMAGAMMLGATIAPAFAFHLINGSFETGNLSNPVFTTVNTGDTNITGWTVASGSVDYIGSYWEPSEGDRSIDMSGDNAGVISKTISTMVGFTYTVTFDMAGNPDGGPTVMNMNVDAGGVPTLYSFNTAGFSRTNMGWTSKTFTFVATSTSTTLTFASLNPGVFGPALDNVAVANTTSKDQCKKDGWKSFGVFKNQGDCVSFVATGGSNLPANQ